MTGGTGFIGGYLIEELIRTEQKVVCVVRDLNSILPKGVIKISLESDSETFLKTLDKFPPKCIYHLATLYLADHSLGDEKLLIESNITFGTFLLELLRKKSLTKIPFINISTSWTHLDEKSFLPVNLYAATKEAFTCLMLYYANSGVIRATTLELSDTYGANDNRRKIIKLLFESVINNKSLDLSPGEQRMDILHVSDVVDAIIYGMRYLLNSEDSWQRYAIRSSKFYSLKEIGKIIEEITGKSGLFNFGGKPYRDNEQMMPILYTQPLPDWSPRLEFRDGLIDLYKSINHAEEAK